MSVKCLQQNTEVKKKRNFHTQKWQMNENIEIQKLFTSWYYREEEYDLLQELYVG